jgi:hypothetical protein
MTDLGAELTQPGSGHYRLHPHESNPEQATKLSQLVQ